MIGLRGPELRLFRTQLLGWFRKYQRDLPWRRTKDSYRIWLSEIMLQQTRVAAVIPYYERFLERFPNVRVLATAPEEEVLRLWSGLGYYSRARNLQRAAKEIVAKHGGIFPRAHNDVFALSGIGDYTSAAILSIAFGEKYAVLDGNVARVLARVFAVRGDLRNAGRWQRLQKAADDLLDSHTPGDWNQAMMELGATVCSPQSPQCLLCPVARFCQARKLGIPESLPAQRKKRESVDVMLAAAVVMDESGRCLLLSPSLRRRRSAGHGDVNTLVSGMWHFPTVAVRHDARTELREALNGLTAEQRNSPAGKKSVWGKRETAALVLEELPKVRHAVTYRNIRVSAYGVRVEKIPGVRGGKIVTLHEVASPSGLVVSNLTRKIARAALRKVHPGVTERAPVNGEATLFPPANTAAPLA